MNPLTLSPSLLPNLVARLTPRQLEIVALLAEGKSNKEIATLLSIGTRTIKFHIKRACNKIEADNRTQLIVVFAMWKAIS
jgi:DNA-binding CsgD family transcriptional regulator